MNEDDEKIADEARKYVKEHQKEIVKHFADVTVFLPTKQPVSLFMAGSPGAGKTEFSKGLIEQFAEKPVRIDADEIRSMLPQHNGTNSYIVQPACGLGVQKIYDEALKHNQNLIMDGTFASYDKALENVKRSLDRGRTVELYYLYQDPFVAWDFTQKREKIEHRNIPKEAFVEEFFNAREDVNRIKKLFGKKVRLNLVIKNYQNGIERLELNIDTVDGYLDMVYIKDNLLKDLI